MWCAMRLQGFLRLWDPLRLHGEVVGTRRKMQRQLAACRFAFSAGRPSYAAAF